MAIPHQEEPDMMQEPPMQTPPPMPDDNMAKGPDMGAPEPQEPMGPDNGEGMPQGNSKLADLASQVDSSGDAEKIKAAEGYLESLVDDKDSDKEPEMPMESKHSLNNLINEIINDVLSNDEDENRDDKTIRNPQVTKNNPFINKRQTVNK